MKRKGKVPRVVRGVVESKHGFLSAYQISQMLHISMNANSWQTKQLFSKILKIVFQLVFKGKIPFKYTSTRAESVYRGIMKNTRAIEHDGLFFPRVKYHFSLRTELHCFWREKKITIFKIKHFLHTLSWRSVCFFFVVSLIRLCSCKQSFNVFQSPLIKEKRQPQQQQFSAR